MSRVRLFSIAVSAGLALAIGVAPAAVAHDELLASDPGEGDRLTVAPTEVSLSFSADVLTMGAAVLVVDGDGRDWVAAEPTVDGSTVTAELEAGMPEAGYEIRWRVVSSDGHPISGLVRFTVGDAEPLTRTPSPTSTAGGDADATEQQTQPTPADAGALRTVLIGAAGAAAAVAIMLLISFLRRRSSVSTQPRDTDAPRDESSAGDRKTS